MSASHLLYYFKGKEAILEQYFDAVAVRFLEQMTEFGKEEPGKQIQLIADFWFKGEAGTKMEIGFMLECFGAAVHDDVLKVTKAEFDLHCKELLSKLFEAAPSDFISSPKDAAEIAYAMMIGLRSAVYFDDDIDLTVVDFEHPEPRRVEPDQRCTTFPHRGLLEARTFRQSRDSPRPPPQWRMLIPASTRWAREGPFAQFIPEGVKAGNLVFLSGQVSIDEHGEVVAPGDLVAQARQAYTHVKATLKKFGAEMDNIVDEMFLVTDVGTAMTGASTNPPTTLASAPSMPAATTMALASCRRSR